MSNFLAVATVTATLNELLRASANTDVAGATVLMMEPNNAANVATQTGIPTINIYLFQVTPNAALRNSDLPTRRSDGTVFQRSQAAIDLHYMISFYGAENELVPQRLLGSVVRTLHAEPQLTRNRIRSTIINPLYAGYLNAPGKESNLADQVELVKFSPLHLSLEELAKIWSVFYQIPYVLSVAYQGTVVLIENEDTPQNALPVQVRNIYAVPFNQPVIDQVGVKADIDLTIVQGKPVTLNDRLRILGKRLQGGAGTLVDVNGVEVIPDPINVSDTQIDLPLNASLTLSDGTKVSPTDKLKAGVQGVQIIQRMQIGVDKDKDQLNWHRGVESNVAAFVLRPAITKTKGKYDIVLNVTGNKVVVNQAGNNIVVFTGTVTVSVAPRIARVQRIVLLLNEMNPNPGQPLDHDVQAFSFTADPNQQTWQDANGKIVADARMFSEKDTTNQIVFSFQNVSQGTYLVRVKVDGAENLLDVDPNGRYVQPQVPIQ